MSCKKGNKCKSSNGFYGQYPTNMMHHPMCMHHHNMQKPAVEKKPAQAMICYPIANQPMQMPAQQPMQMPKCEAMQMPMQQHICPCCQQPMQNYMCGQCHFHQMCNCGMMSKGQKMQPYRGEEYYDEFDSLEAMNSFDSDDMHYDYDYDLDYGYEYDEELDEE